MSTSPYKKMNPTVKALWIEALESGRYRQGKHVLRTDSDTYCCLGVLCDLVKPDGWKQKSDENIFELSHWRFGRDSLQLPPATILRKVGLGRTAALKLAAINDGASPARGKFRTIVKWIKENL
jgi:hypothetical protein